MRGGYSLGLGCTVFGVSHILDVGAAPCGTQSVIPGFQALAGQLLKIVVQGGSLLKAGRFGEQFAITVGTADGDVGGIQPLPYGKG